MIRPAVRGSRAAGDPAAIAESLAGDEVPEVRSVERTRRGFRVHYARASSRSVRVRPRLRRDVEAHLRELGAVIVDEYGAQIDASQFEKEADPAFRKLRTNDDLPSLLYGLLVPNWYLRWRFRRVVRQSSDDA